MAQNRLYLLITMGFLTFGIGSVIFIVWYSPAVAYCHSVDRLTTANGQAKAEDLKRLAINAREIFFEQYCKKCHHGAEPKSGINDYDVLDYKSLTKKRIDNGEAWYYVKPGAKGEEALRASYLWEYAGVKGEAGARGSMPPPKEAKQPTDKHRREILQRWLEAGAPPWPEKQIAKASDGKLWLSVQRIFEERCMNCHKKGGSAYVEDFHLGSHASLIKERNETKPKLAWNKSPWYYVKPKSPDLSLLYHAIKSNQMPKSGKKLTDQQKAIVKNWIEAGAPGPPPVEKRTFLAQNDQLKAISNHLWKTPERERPFQRYFTFTHLHNDVRISKDKLDLFRAALSKMINSLSWNTKMVIPKAIEGTNNTVYAVNYSELGWARDGLWEEICKKYPYGLMYGADSKTIARLSKTTLPYLRADWFIATASRPPFYHLLLDLPDSADALESQLGIDFIQNFLQGKMVRAGYNGASTATSGNRVVERQEIKKYYQGGYWKSYDFGVGPKVLPKNNPHAFPLGPTFPKHKHPFDSAAFEHDGNEIIFSLPNGLQGYMITSRDGKRLDEAPAWILKDKNEFSGRPQIVNGISCIACHSSGMQMVRDQVQLNVGAGKIPPVAEAHVKVLYVQRKIMSDLIEQDQKRFEGAVKDATNSFLGANGIQRTFGQNDEMIYQISSHFLGSLDLGSVAYELNFSDVDKLRRTLTDNPNIWQDLFLRNRLLKDNTITRSEWNQVFIEAARRLGRGTPIDNLRKSGRP